jgi:hypothetical protein
MVRIKMGHSKGSAITMKIITLDDMTRAIANRMGINVEKARGIAGFVMDLFGYNDRIIDNILNPEDRQLFYILEAEGMLTTGREETTLYDGRAWLTHYWQLRKNTILRYAKNDIKRDRNILSVKKQIKEAPMRNIYSVLSEEIWNARKINRKNIYL